MSVVTKNGDNEIVPYYSYDNYVFPELHFKKGRKKRTGLYCTIPAAYDIETTSYQGIRNANDEWEDEPYGIVYHWQVCFNGDIIMGRTMEEFACFLNRMVEYYSLSSNKHIMFYSHNLGFEWQHSQAFIGKYNDLFAVKMRTPLSVRLACGIELRCSWKLSNMSLLKFCENTPGNPYIKADGDLDYDIFRLPSTPLSWRERMYCASDVKCLYHAIIAKMEEEGDDLETIPLTSTGYVRRRVLDSCNADSGYRRLFVGSRLYAPEYVLLRRAASGGDTHANRYLSNRIWLDCDSYDATSSYPYVLLTKKYPISRFRKYGRVTSKEEFKKLIDNYACIFKIYFKGLKIKPDAIDPVISSSKCRIRGKAEYDNGRVLYAEELITCITDIDYKEIEKYYTADKIIISQMYYAKYGYIPKPIRNVIKELFVEKCRLGELRDSYPEDSEEWEHYDYLYNKQKNLLNGIFGMMFTDPVRSIIYENDDYSWKEEKPDYEDIVKISKSLDKFYNNRKSFVHFSWGVWTTAHARAHLHRLLDAGTSDSGMGVYWDTDSLKGFELNVNAINAVNDNIIKECEEREAYCTINDTKYYLGVFKKEKPMKQFITMGAKKYCYTDREGKLHITISGVNKKEGAKELESIYNFKKDFTFVKSASKKMHYNDNGIRTIKINGEDVVIGPSASLLPNTYTLGLESDYEKLLERIITTCL